MAVQPSPAINGATGFPLYAGDGEKARGLVWAGGPFLAYGGTRERARVRVSERIESNGWLGQSKL